MTQPKTDLFPGRPPGSLVTKTEILDRLEISSMALTRLIRAGKWPAPAHVGAFLRWTVDECNAAFDALRSREPIAGRGPKREGATA